jgi:hypothetical protein
MKAAAAKDGAILPSSVCDSQIGSVFWPNTSIIFVLSFPRINFDNAY